MSIPGGLSPETWAMAETVAARAGLSGRGPESLSIPLPPPRPTFGGEAVRLQRQSIAASLAGGMIAASGRPHTAAEAVAVLREVEGVLG